MVGKVDREIGNVEASLEVQRAKLGNLENATPWEIERLQENIANLEAMLPIGHHKKEDNMRGNTRKRHKYYEEHKDEIIADLLSIGKGATMKKWNISAGGTMPQLMKRWLTPEQIALLPGEQRPKSSFSMDAIPLSNNVNIMPRFPEFKDTWEREVQVRWLELYVELKGQSKK